MQALNQSRGVAAARENCTLEQRIRAIDDQLEIYNLIAGHPPSGIVAAKVFLGDHLDFQVKVGEFALLARVHPSLRTPTGDPIQVRMRAARCVAIAEAAAPRAAAQRMIRKKPAPGLTWGGYRFSDKIKRKGRP